ncbi:MAG: hypothetical protein AB7V62_03475 [Thermoleophilia bacterium]
MAFSSLPFVDDRSLHLVDVENLIGTPNPRCGEVDQIASLYAVVAGVAPMDQEVIASSHRCAKSAWFEWRTTARRLVRSGIDGADRALLEVLENEQPGQRYSRVVIGSGDGIFAEPAARLQASGVNVTVVTREHSLSRRLRLATLDIRFLDAPLAEGAAVAMLEAA